MYLLSVSLRICPQKLRRMEKEKEREADAAIAAYSAHKDAVLQQRAAAHAADVAAKEAVRQRNVASLEAAFLQAPPPPLRGPPSHLATTTDTAAAATTTFVTAQLAQCPNDTCQRWQLGCPPTKTAAAVFH